MKIKRKNLILLIIVGILLLVLIFGSIFFFNDKEVDNNPPSENHKPNIQEAPKVQIVDINSKSKPYAVMINNLSKARPYHTGLQNAYLVYEMVVEGGITRYMALFKDVNLEEVGNVRSSRHYYLDYVMENDAIYVHWGGSPKAYSDISTLGINNFDGMDGSSYFYRKDLPVKGAEHRTFINFNGIKKLAAKKYSTNTEKGLLLNYSASPINVDAIAEKQVANSLSFKYSNTTTSSYQYDKEKKVYKMLVNDTPHTDYATKEQYTVKNIIVYQVKNKTIDSYGRQDLENLGTGEGYFITNGYAMPITWEKKDRSSQTIYRYKDGTEITVNDGNTWIHIVPTSGNIRISE